jgi:hypothetical protein
MASRASVEPPPTVCGTLQRQGELLGGEFRPADRISGKSRIARERSRGCNTPCDLARQREVAFTKQSDWFEPILATVPGLLEDQQAAQVDCHSVAG